MFRCLRLRKHFPKYTNHKKWLDLLVSLQMPVNKYAQNTGASGTTAPSLPPFTPTRHGALSFYPMYCHFHPF